MLSRKKWVLRLSIILNLVGLFYFAIHTTPRNEESHIIEEIWPEIFFDEIEEIRDDSPSSPSGHMVSQSQITKTVLNRKSVRASTVVTMSTDKNLPPIAPAFDIQNTSTAHSLKEVISCNDRSIEFRIAQRGDYWVLYNYIRAKYRPRCWETITYTTHADYTFLNDNLETLLERWQGPISLALYAPGTDFQLTVFTILYLRDCGSPLVKNYVTFHIYFPSNHLPKYIPKGDEIFKTYVNCKISPPWLNSTRAIYKTKKKLLYPINVGRNIARESAVTHYILASDIELYPSPEVIQNFLAMIQRQDPLLRHKNPKVFALPIFEFDINMSLPANKKELVGMIKKGTAIQFHKEICVGCQRIPKAEKWLNATSDSKELHVFHTGKRTSLWEPIYIGTYNDPLYDERLSWEGKNDKMIQGYILCVLDYDIHILDNAFLVHKPGIKKPKIDLARNVIGEKTYALIRKKILPELKILYGIRKGCSFLTNTYLLRKSYYFT